MPSIIEIKYPFLKYCQKQDVHCECMTCLQFNDGCPSCRKCNIKETKQAEIQCLKNEKPNDGCYITKKPSITDH